MQVLAATAGAEGLTKIDQMKLERQRRLEQQRQEPHAVEGAAKATAGDEPPPGLTKIEQMKWRRLQNVQKTREKLAGAEGQTLSFQDLPGKDLARDLEDAPSL